MSEELKRKDAEIAALKRIVIALEKELQTCKETLKQIHDLVTKIRPVERS